MSNTESIRGTPSLQSWLDTLGEGSFEKVLRSEGEVGAVSEMKPSEKQRIEELSIAGLPFLPPPYISYQTFREVADEFNKCFGIERAHGSAPLSIAESSALMGVFSEYTKVAGGNIVAALVGASVGANPLEKVLNNYMENARLIPIRSLTTEVVHRQFPALTAALRTVDPTLVEKAFRLAQQQIVLAMLQQWTESTQKIAEMAREYRKEQDLKTQEIKDRILSDYVKDSWKNQPSITQPAFAMLLGTIAIDTSLITTIQSIAPALSAAQITAAPILHIAVASEFTILAAGILASTVTWATPIAISLSRGSPHESEKQFAKDAAKAYAIALVGILLSESVNNYLIACVEKAVNNHLLPKDQAETVLATFKASLLISAMALLYKSETGGITGGELKGILNGSMSLSEDDFLLTLAKLIKEQLERINPSDKEGILLSIFNSYDKDPSLSALLDPIKIFTAMWDPRFFRAANIERPA